MPEESPCGLAENETVAVDSFSGTYSIVLRHSNSWQTDTAPLSNCGQRRIFIQSVELPELLPKLLPCFHLSLCGGRDAANMCFYIHALIAVQSQKILHSRYYKHLRHRRCYFESLLLHDPTECAERKLAHENNKTGLATHHTDQTDDLMIHFCSSKSSWLRSCAIVTE
jgi:hypothetical protein